MSQNASELSTNHLLLSTMTGHRVRALLAYVYGAPPARTLWLAGSWPVCTTGPLVHWGTQLGSTHLNAQTPPWSFPCTPAGLSQWRHSFECISLLSCWSVTDAPVKEALNAALNCLFCHRLGFLSKLQAEMACTVDFALLRDNDPHGIVFRFQILYALINV